MSDDPTPLPEGFYDTTNVITNPGPEYACKDRKFQGIPAIERAPNGRLWAAWYGGGITEDRHNYVMLATSDDDGATWGAPQLIIDPDGPGPLRAYDQVLWHDPDGRLWLFWNQNLGRGGETFTEEDQRNWWVWAICTQDSGSARPVWSPPRRLFEAVMMNKPIALSSGDWLACSSDWFWDCSARVFRSTDKGETWNHWGRAHVPKKEDRAFDEHMVVERRDTSIWMLLRTKYGIGESTSSDRGRTWRYVTPSGIGHCCSRFFIRRLQSGNLLLVKHGRTIEEATEKRSHLSAFLSTDDGQSWQGGLLLDERAGCSYPDGVEGEDGLIYTIHDYDRAGDKTILLSKFTEADILAGELTDERSSLLGLINQALGVNPRVEQKPWEQA